MPPLPSTIAAYLLSTRDRGKSVPASVLHALKWGSEGFGWDLPLQSPLITSLVFNSNTVAASKVKAAPVIPDSLVLGCERAH